VHDRPVPEDVAQRDNGQSNQSFLSKAEQSCPKGKFWLSLADETQKVSPNNHLRRCPGMVVTATHSVRAVALRGLRNGEIRVDHPFRQRGAIDHRVHSTFFPIPVVAMARSPRAPI
jgi:hypothetical protein